MTDLQWFAFVVLPIRVTVFGALLAAAGVGLIIVPIAAHRHQRFWERSVEAAHGIWCL